MPGDPSKRIVEGEVSGFPVPGGWPNRGPFDVVRDLLRRKRKAKPAKEDDTTDAAE